MTREDAIKTLKELWRETNDPWYEEVYNMAIDALNADCKTENSSEKPNNCEDEPQRDMAEDIVRSFGFKAESYRQAKAKDEPQTEKE